MEALAHLEAIGYTVEFYDDEVQELFRVTGFHGEPLPETVWLYCDQHKEEIRQTLRDRKTTSNH